MGRQGEALGHSWQEATFHQPRTCGACGVTEGKKNLSFFEKHRVNVAARMNSVKIAAMAVDHETKPKRMETVDVKVTMKSHAANPSKDRPGYTTYVMMYELRCAAPKFAKGFGVDMGNICDYYTGYVFEDRPTYGTDVFVLNDSVTVDGQKYTLYYFKLVEWGQWIWSKEDNAAVSLVSVAYQIDAPEGYDGLLLFFEDQTEWVPYTDNDTIFSCPPGRSRPSCARWPPEAPR